MSIKKYKFQIISAIFLISLVLFLSIRQQKDVGDDKNKVKLEKIPTPYLSKEYDGKFPININVNPDTTILPPKIMVYEIQNKPFTLDQVKKIASSLGFDVDNYRLNEDKIVGKTYSFTLDNKNLRIVPSYNIIDYKIKELLLGTISITDESFYINSAREFITSKGLITNPENLQFDRLQFFKLDEMGHLSDTDKPNVVRVNFIKKINNYTVISPSYETGSVSVVFNSSKELILAYIDDIPELKDYKEYDVKNIEQIKQDVQNSSSLKSIKEGLISPFDLNDGSITEANIESIEMAYIQELKLDQKFLQPVFVLSGKIKTTEYGEVAATILLPAI